MDGRRLRKGRLFRSGDPSHAHGAALRQLESLGLRTIIDLRSGRERRHGELALPGARTVALPIAIEELTRERLRPVLHQRHAEAAVIAVMSSVYHDMVDLALGQIGALLRLLLDPNTYPALIHCKAGKDRTGFACAIVQLIVGIAPEAIVEDYLRSSDFTLPAARKTLFWSRLLSFGLLPTRNLETVFAAQPHYLLAALERISRVYGGVDAYLEQAGFPQGGFAQLQVQLLEA